MNKVDKDLVWKALGEQYDLAFVQVFIDNNAKVYLFGGVPRDVVMGRKWKDADFCICIPLATEEKDEKAESIFKENDIDVTSKTVLSNGITVYRFKDKSSNRLVDIRVVNDIWAGGADFTVNSLRLDIETGELIDCYGAIADIKSKVIRTIVKPEERFKDDFTMLFRAVKAVCQLHFFLNDEVKATMKVFLHQIDICLDIIVKNESDFAEWVLSNIFSGLKSNPHEYFSVLEEVGALHFFAKSLANRLQIQGVITDVPNPFLLNTKYSYEKAISTYLSAVAQMIDVKDPVSTFSKIVNYLGITKPKRGDDFIVNSSDIVYQSKDEPMAQ